MKLFKSFCKKELINRGVTLRNQKIAFSKKDLITFKYFIFALKIKNIFKNNFYNCGKYMFKNCKKQLKIHQRILLIGNVFQTILKTQKLEKIKVLKELLNFHNIIKKSKFTNFK